MNTHQAYFLVLTVLSTLFIGRVAVADSTEGAAPSAVGSDAAANDEVNADEQAKASFSEATALYNDGKYEASAQKFNEAYRLKPAWKLLYNIAQAEAASKRQGLAIEAFEKYLTEGGDDIPMERRDEVLKEIERLRLIVGSVELEAPDGYSVFVDGVNRGTTPLLGKMRISASQKHVIELRDGDTVLDSKSIQAAGQEVLKVKLGSGLTSRTTTTVGTTVVTSNQLSPAQMNDRHRRKLLRQSKIFKIAGWSSLGVGGGLVVIGLIGLGQAKAQKDENDSTDCSGDSACETQLESDIADQELLRDGSLGLLVLGAAAMITSPFLLKISKKKKQRAESLQTAMVPVLTPSFAGVSFAGTF